MAIPPFFSIISGSFKPASLHELITFKVPRPHESIYPPRKQALASTGLRGRELCSFLRSSRLRPYGKEPSFQRVR